MSQLGCTILESGGTVSASSRLSQCVFLIQHCSVVVFAAMLGLSKSHATCFSQEGFLVRMVLTRVFRRPTWLQESRRMGAARRAASPLLDQNETRFIIMIETRRKSG